MRFGRGLVLRRRRRRVSRMASAAGFDGDGVDGDGCRWRRRFGRRGFGGHVTALQLASAMVSLSSHSCGGAGATSLGDLQARTFSSGVDEGRCAMLGRGWAYPSATGDPRTPVGPGLLVGGCNGLKFGAAAALVPATNEGGEAKWAEVGRGGKASGCARETSLLKPDVVRLPPAGRAERKARGEGVADAEPSLLPDSVGDSRALMSMLGRK